MNFYELWQRLDEITLYHGTVVDNEPTIRKHGLVGGWHGPIGPWVQDAYGDDYQDIEPSEEDEIVFLADKEKISAAVSAMVFHIGKKLGKEFHSVSNQDIRNHGLLVISKDNEITDDSWGGVRHADEDDGRSLPRGVEPGDYFADRASADILLRGSALIRFLRKMGQLPRTWGPSSSPQDMKKARGELVAAMMTDYPLFPKEDIIAHIQGMSDYKVMDYLQKRHR